MGLTVSVSPIFSGLGPCGCPWWMATWKQLYLDVHMQKRGGVSGTKRSDSTMPGIFCSSNTAPSPFLTPCPCQPGCFKCRKAEKSTVSLSYAVHQVDITAADRTVYPRRPCVLPASAEVSVTLPPDWTLFHSDCGPSASEHLCVHSVPWTLESH